MEHLPEMNKAIAIAKGVMERLFAEGEKDQAKGAEKVWNALIDARNAAQNFETNVINFPLETADCSITFHRGV